MVARMFTPLVALAALLGGCIDAGTYAVRPEITSEVADWRDEIIYQVLVDRFADGDVNNNWNVAKNPDALARHLGGDYQGLIDRVDYLQALGITAIWISPVVTNVEEDAGVAGYHGYWTQDFERVNPHFGDLPKLRELVDVMHGAGIKVIVDIVTNHVGQAFYYDVNRNGQPDITIFGAGDQDSLDGFGRDPIEVISEWDPAWDPRGVQGWTSLGESGPAPVGWVYMPEINRVPPLPEGFRNPSWYNRKGRVVDWNDRAQVLEGDFPGGLKDLDTTNPEVVEALVDVFQRWITETNIDGYRIDTVKHIEHDFWQTFCPAIRGHCEMLGKERFLMFGEIFDGDDALIGSYTAPDELDSAFYFSHKFQIFDDIYMRGGPTTRVEQLLAQRPDNYGTTPQPGGIGLAPVDALVTFIDNHDIPRFLYGAQDPRSLAPALVHLLTWDGIPCLYYGTEQGFAGGNDPANREPLWWSDYRTNTALFQHVAGLTRLRRAYPALRYGDVAIRWATDRTGDEEDAHMLAFERTFEDERALVVVNTGDGTSSTSFSGAAMPVGFAPGTRLVPVFPLSGGEPLTVGGDGRVRVELGPYEAVVLVAEGQTRPLPE